MTCLADFSGPVTTLPWLSRSGEPVAGSLCGTPALRKYLLTMMSVASWLHCRGISASFISKTTDPSGLVMRLVRRSYSTDAKGSCPDLVKRRLVFMTKSFCHICDMQFAFRVSRKLLTHLILQRHGHFSDHVLISVLSRTIPRGPDPPTHHIRRPRVDVNSELMPRRQRARENVV